MTKGKLYWSIDSFGRPFSKIWDDDWVDKMRLEDGRAFPTRESIPLIDNTKPLSKQPKAVDLALDMLGL